MTPVFDVSTGGVRPLAGAERTSAPPAERTLEEERRRPVTDEYVPEEPREPSGLYRVDRDQAGRPQVSFDDRSQVEAAPQKPETPEAENTDAPERDGQGEERCTANTDRVDRELRALKEKRQTLERQLETEADDTRRRALERELAQVERALAQKDTDAYRRRHTRFS